MSKFTTLEPKKKPNFDEAVKSALRLKDKYGDNIISIVTEQYSTRLEPYGYHGIPHWERVLVNGLMLKQMLPDHVSEDAVFLFALFHDSKRENEGHDVLHGMRGADYFKHCYDSGFIPLHLMKTDLEPMQIISIVVRACSYHTMNLFDSDPRVAACFDADRLDLERVGIYPDIAKLNYQTAISKALIYECSIRAREILTTPIFRKEDESEKCDFKYTG